LYDRIEKVAGKINIPEKREPSYDHLGMIPENSFA
jgi:hypothetical protein|tara:strand:- start:1517 stop:1621 length:105 start_codon:yes stop_codon:yes gene_type:complete